MNYKSLTKSTGVFFAGLLLISFVSGCGNNQKDEANNENSDTLVGTISLSGAFALYPMAVKWAEEFQKINPGVKIDVSAGGAGKGMTDALSGMVDMGMFSKSVGKEEEAQGAWWIAVTKDAVLPTINAKNPVLKELKVKGLTQQQFADIFLSKNKPTWGKITGTSNATAINLFTRSDACGAAEMWAKYLGEKQEDLNGTGVFGDPGIADAVKKDPNSIGFNNVIYVYDLNTKKIYDGLEVIPLDVNANGTIDPEENFYGTLTEISQAIKDGKYPSPPARELYFVSKGKPTKKIMVAFLNWILTDGQKFVQEGGYVHLDQSRIDTELNKLK